MEVEQLTSNKFSKKNNVTVLQWMLFIFQFTDNSGEIFTEPASSTKVKKCSRTFLEYF